jgi:hypothetical protein
MGVNVDAARLGDPAEVVSLEVDDHHVLGALLRVGDELGDERRVGVASAPRGRVPLIGRVSTWRRARRRKSSANCTRAARRRGRRSAYAPGCRAASRACSTHAGPVERRVNACVRFTW